CDRAPKSDASINWALLATSLIPPPFFGATPRQSKDGGAAFDLPTGASGTQRMARARSLSAARPTLVLMSEPHGAFGQDTFGRAAERGARFFGTPQYIIGQTFVVIA